MSSSFFSDISSTYAKVVTPADDTNTLLRNAKYLMNTGTAGAFTVRQNTTAGRPGVAPSANSTVVVGLAQYQIIPVPASWVGANSTGLGGGVVLVAFF